MNPHHLKLLNFFNLKKNNDIARISLSEDIQVSEFSSIDESKNTLTLYENTNGFHSNDASQFCLTTQSSIIPQNAVCNENVSKIEDEKLPSYEHSRSRSNSLIEKCLKAHKSNREDGYYSEGGTRGKKQPCCNAHGNNRNKSNYGCKCYQKFNVCYNVGNDMNFSDKHNADCPKKSCLTKCKPPKEIEMCSCKNRSSITDDKILFTRSSQVRNDGCNCCKSVNKINILISKECLKCEPEILATVDSDKSIVISCKLLNDNEEVKKGCKDETDGVLDKINTLDNATLYSEQKGDGFQGEKMSLADDARSKGTKKSLKSSGKKSSKGEDEAQEKRKKRCCYFCFKHKDSSAEVQKK